MITKEESRKKFNQLSAHEQLMLQNYIIGMRKGANHFNIDVPYYIWSIYPKIFLYIDKKVEEEFLNIDDVETFSIYIVYILSLYIIRKRQRNNSYK